MVFGRQYFLNKIYLFLLQLKFPLTRALLWGQRLGDGPAGGALSTAVRALQLQILR